VRAWLRGARSPSGVYAERLAELSSLVERLTHVMQPAYVPLWLRKPIPLLDDDKPLDVIAAGDYGGYRACWRVWKPPALRSGWTSTASRCPGSGTARSRVPNGRADRGYRADPAAARGPPPADRADRDADVTLPSRS
jgi:hypothetical protein